MNKPRANIAADSTTICLKLLIDARGKRVVFAEAGKEFVDFLFRILSLPVVTVVGLLGKDAMVGSLANVHGSVENLNDSYILPTTTKDTFLKPAASFSLAAPPAMPNMKKFYRCGWSNHYSFVSDDPSAVCPSCAMKMTRNLSFVQAAGGGGGGGVVKGLVSYMVMDDLTVMPLSTSSTITVLNNLNVKSVAALEEKVVHLGMDEAVKLLIASLQSKNVLTDVFVKDTKSDAPTRTVKTEGPATRTVKNNTPGRTGVKRERTN